MIVVYEVMASVSHRRFYIGEKVDGGLKYVFCMDEIRGERGPDYSMLPDPFFSETPTKFESANIVSCKELDDKNDVEMVNEYTKRAQAFRLGKSGLVQATPNKSF